jgi:IclR family pca regulon transcriptional regulator
VNPRIFGFIHDFALRFGSNSKFDPLLSETAIRLQCSVYMSMLADRSTYVICAVGKDGGTTHLGSHGPAYATSSGKILVAHKPEDEWPAYAPTIHDEALTSHTDLSEDHYYQEIRQARLNGFAWNLRETAKQHASVAAAVKERLISTPRMAVALLVNYHELSIYSRETLEKEVVALAKLVSDAI